jgi:hypothetical protein
MKAKKQTASRGHPDLQHATPCKHRKICVHDQSSSGFGRAVNCAADLIVGTAPANVGYCFIDVLITWLSVLVEESCSRHDHAGLTIAALRNVLGHPRSQQPMVRIDGQALDGRNIGVLDIVYACCAGGPRSAVYVDGACPTGSYPATELGASQPEIVPQDPKQGRIGIGVDFVSTPVDFDAYGHNHPPQNHYKGNSLISWSLRFGLRPRWGNPSN